MSSHSTAMPITPASDRTSDGKTNRVSDRDRGELRGLPHPASDDQALAALLEAGGEPVDPLELRRWLELAEAWYIARTLRALRGNRSAAARALGIGRRTLYAKMQKLGIEERWRVGSLEPPHP